MHIVIFEKYILPETATIGNKIRKLNNTDNEEKYTSDNQRNTYDM